ncbi:IS110 family transposase [Candidatus Saccharibacteria bacterium]|nr:IS110 family transposase [Candidatus Saccharibacteria bacterium]
MNNDGIISYEGKKVSFGIDVHRGFFVISGVYEGELVKRCRTKPSGEVIVGFIRKFFPGCIAQSCYEAGFSGFWLHRHLERAGIRNIVVNPASVEVEAGNRVKTDKRDSLKLAQQLDANRLRGIFIPSESQENSRLLIRTREQLVRARTRARIQIRMKLHQFGLFPVGHSKVLTTKFARQLIDHVEQAELKISLNSLFSQWEHLNQEIKNLEKELRKQADNDRLEATYRSVPGIGALIARVLATELGDMSQFPNERALFSYTGLTPCEYSSGDNVRRGRISRQGSSRLRHALTEAAWRAIRKDVSLKNDFERIANRRGKKRAIVAIGRKLIGRVRAVFKTRGVYQIEYNNAA